MLGMYVTGFQHSLDAYAFSFLLGSCLMLVVHACHEPRASYESMHAKCPNHSVWLTGCYRKYNQPTKYLIYCLAYLPPLTSLPVLVDRCIVIATPSLIGSLHPVALILDFAGKFEPIANASQCNGLAKQAMVFYKRIYRIEHYSTEREDDHSTTVRPTSAADHVYYGRIQAMA